jgi:hypothetical protein
VFDNPAIAGDLYVNPNFPINGGCGAKNTTLSPPVIAAVNECATHVYVQSFMPKAKVRVFLNGTTPIGTATPVFAFDAVALSGPLHTGDKLTATQTVNGLTSAPGLPVVVGAMPAALPAPTVGKDIYACGRVVPVHNLLPGVAVSVQDASVGSATIGGGFTPNDWGTDWVPAVTSSLVNGHKITAVQSACGKPPGPSTAPESVQADPAPMLSPVLDKPIVGNDAITFHHLYTGSTIEAFDHASSIGSGLATGADNWMHVPAIGAAALISARQSLCSSSPSSKPQPPVKSIPPPRRPGSYAVRFARTLVAASG